MTRRTFFQSCLAACGTMFLPVVKAMQPAATELPVSASISSNCVIRNCTFTDHVGSCVRLEPELWCVADDGIYSMADGEPV